MRFQNHFPVSNLVIDSNEVAWPSALAAAFIEWFGAHGYAVLGTEVLLPHHGTLQSLPYFQSVDRTKDEAWDSFVARATAETLAYLRRISQKIVEEGDVYINVTWVSEADWRRWEIGVLSEMACSRQ